MSVSKLGSRAATAAPTQSDKKPAIDKAQIAQLLLKMLSGNSLNTGVTSNQSGMMQDPMADVMNGNFSNLISSSLGASGIGSNLKDSSALSTLQTAGLQGGQSAGGMFGLGSTAAGLPNSPEDSPFDMNALQAQLAAASPESVTGATADPANAAAPALDSDGQPLPAANATQAKADAAAAPAKVAPAKSEFKDNTFKISQPDYAQVVQLVRSNPKDALAAVTALVHAALSAQVGAQATEATKTKISDTLLAKGAAPGGDDKAKTQQANSAEADIAKQLIASVPPQPAAQPIKVEVPQAA